MSEWIAYSRKKKVKRGTQRRGGGGFVWGSNWPKNNKDVNDIFANLNVEVDRHIIKKRRAVRRSKKLGKRHIDRKKRTPGVRGMGKNPRAGRSGRGGELARKG